MDDGIVDREIGLAQVHNSNKEWMRRALLICMQWRINALRDDLPANFLPEDLRKTLIAQIGEPTHSNAWGALTRTLIDKKIIETNGEMRPMRSRTSHARLTRAYTWTPL